MAKNPDEVSLLLEMTKWSSLATDSIARHDKVLREVLATMIAEAPNETARDKVLHIYGILDGIDPPED